MKKIYLNLMKESKRIADTFPPPKFYDDFGGMTNLSREIYQKEKVIVECRRLIQGELEDDFGHGTKHARKVSLDAGTLTFIEGKNISLDGTGIRRMAIISQVAGLLHDIKRKEKNHAAASARRAEELLEHLSLNKEEKGYVVDAIFNHEAMVTPRKISSPIGQMISDVLYDADKFRWGPDNYTDTAWYMVDYYKIPFEELADNFHRAMGGIIRMNIRESFRTKTGRKYGPEFIDLGLELGNKIQQFIKKISYDQKSGEALPESFK